MRRTLSLGWLSFFSFIFYLSCWLSPQISDESQTNKRRRVVVAVAVPVDVDVANCLSKRPSGQQGMQANRLIKAHFYYDDWAAQFGGWVWVCGSALGGSDQVA